MIILDTCVLLWLADAQDNLSENALHAIKSEAGDLLVSAITAFELGIKVRKKKLILPLPPCEWYEKALALHGIIEAALTGKIAAQSAVLPPIHNDSCDRFIIATSLLLNCAVITPDKQFAAYPGMKVIW